MGTKNEIFFYPADSLDYFHCHANASEMTECAGSAHVRICIRLIEGLMPRQNPHGGWSVPPILPSLSFHLNGCQFSFSLMGK